MWIILALIVALFSGIRRIYDKGLTGHFGNFTMPFIINTFSLFSLWILLFFFPIPTDPFHLSAHFWVPLFVSCVVVYPLQIYLYIRAVREGEVSSVVPLMATSPVFSIFTSFIFIGESPSLLGYIGIACIVTGIFVLLKKKGVRMTRRPELYMLASMFLFGLASTVDKIAIQASTAIFYTVINSVVSLVVLYICVLYTRERVQFHKVPALFWKLLLVGTMLTISYAGTELAFALGPTSYVLAVRSGAFVITALWGFIKLKEKGTPAKILAILAFIVGTVLLAFA